MEVDSQDEQDVPFLDTVEGEISLFRGITRARPVGIHKHWHMLTLINSIKLETGRIISPKDAWRKLETLYNLEALEDLDAEGEGEELQDSSSKTNLQTHPCFKSEFSLPHEPYEPLIAPRRLDEVTTATNTRPSSPETPKPGGSGSRPTGVPTTGGSTSKDFGAFDSEGELTEEEEGLGGGGDSENNEGSGAGDEAKPPGKKRARSRSVRTARSEALSVGVDDVDMAEVEDQPSPAPSGTGTKSSRRRASAAATANASASNAPPKKKPPPPPQPRTRNAAAAAAQAAAAAPSQRGKRKK